MAIFSKNRQKSHSKSKLWTSKITFFLSKIVILLNWWIWLQLIVIWILFLLKNWFLFKNNSNLIYFGFEESKIIARCENNVFLSKLTYFRPKYEFWIRRERNGRSWKWTVPKTSELEIGRSSKWAIRKETRDPKVNGHKPSTLSWLFPKSE